MISDTYTVTVWRRYLSDARWQIRHTRTEHRTPEQVRQCQQVMTWAINKRNNN